MLLRCTAVEEPSDAVSVNREDRTVADYESVARALSILQTLFYSLIIRTVEIDENECIISYLE